MSYRQQDLLSFVICTAITAAMAWACSVGLEHPDLGLVSGILILFGGGMAILFGLTAILQLFSVIFQPPGRS